MSLLQVGLGNYLGEDSGHWLGGQTDVVDVPSLRGISGVQFLAAMTGGAFAWNEKLSVHHEAIMGLLVAYIVLTFLVVLWIAWDSETICIFDVFGKSFHYVWFDSGKRWTFLFAYGWRLAVVCTVVLVNTGLCYRLYAANPFQLGAPIHALAFAIMFAGSFTAIPWIYMAERIRWRRQVHRAALRLTELAKRMTTDQDYVQTLQRADYATEEPWTAWHPNDHEWQTEEGKQFWSDLLPVVYVRDDSHGAVVFPIDFESFLGWNIPGELGRVDSELPFRGPFDASFRVKSVWPLRGCSGWCLIRTEMRSELDARLDDCGEQAVLADRTKRLESGEATVSEWSEAKKRLDNLGQ